MNLKNNLLKLSLCFCFVFFILSQTVYANPKIQRFGGDNRYETSVKISSGNWQTSNYVILVSGENFPDALSATPLSKKYNAPILLTKSNNLDWQILQEIKRLGVKNAILVGGNAVISKNVEIQLNNKSIKTSRIWGNNRYETSVKVAENIGLTKGAFIVSGENFPDAVSVASIASTKSMPIILTSSLNLSNGAKQLIYKNNKIKYYVVGGNGSISNKVVAGINNYKRLGGTDRYYTNKNIINEFRSSLNFDYTYVASSLSFPDALSGSAAAAKKSSPVILIGKTVHEANYIIRDNKANINMIGIFGGTAVVPTYMINKIIDENTNTNNGKIKVCLDAGHGGYDSGAVGPTGVKEKDVTLAITLKLGRILKAKGIDVIYTRTSDSVSWPSNETLDLQKRCDIANNANVQYFIAIHANSASISNAKGTEVYYSSGSEKGAELANSIQNEIIRATSLYNRGTKTANFYVLRHTDAPATLVETGFISNVNEERLLNSENFQQVMANAIAKGILNYVS